MQNSVWSCSYVSYSVGARDSVSREIYVCPIAPLHPYPSFRMTSARQCFHKRLFKLAGRHGFWALFAIRPHESETYTRPYSRGPANVRHRTLFESEERTSASRCRHLPASPDDIAIRRHNRISAPLSYANTETHYHASPENGLRRRERYPITKLFLSFTFGGLSLPGSMSQ